MPTVMPTTAAELLAAVRPYGPVATGNDLTLTDEAPALPTRLLGVLHTGVRALLVNRPWYGCGSTSEHAAPVQLKHFLPIPVGITLLCVGGDDRWHRLHESARKEFPALFAVPEPPKVKAARKRPDLAETAQ